MRAFEAADGFGVARLAGAFMLTWGGLRFLSVIAPQGIGVVELPFRHCSAPPTPWLSAY